MRIIIFITGFFIPLSLIAQEDTNLLNLKDIGMIYSREELVEEITSPSLRIKPSMMATRILKHNGDVILGRVVSADEQQVRVMITGNSIVDIARSDIRSEESHNESLMYEDLLAGLSEDDVNALLSYLMSLHLNNETDF